MRKTWIISIVFLMSTWMLMACGQSVVENHGEKPYGHYDDDKMIGFVWDVDIENREIEVDISEWEKRDQSGDMTDEGYTYRAQITEDTVLRHEDGTETTLDEVKKGQKVLVDPPRDDDFAGEPDEVVLLEMTYEEKFNGLLSHVEDKLNVVVMYEDGENLPSEMDERLMENLEPTPVGRWMPYEQDYVVDYKKEFNIEAFPVILVFDSEELVLKTDDIEELLEFFDGLGGTEQSKQEDDFEVTIEAEKNEKLDVQATITYVGDEDETDIYHGGSIFFFNIYQTDGDFEHLGGMDQPLLSTTLTKDEPHHVEFSSMALDELAPGTYEFEAIADFSLDDENMMESRYEIPVSTIGCNC